MSEGAVLFSDLGEYKAEHVRPAKKAYDGAMNSGLPDERAREAYRRAPEGYFQRIRDCPYYLIGPIPAQRRTRLHYGEVLKLNLSG